MSHQISQIGKRSLRVKCWLYTFNKSFVSNRYQDDVIKLHVCFSKNSS